MQRKYETYLFFTMINQAEIIFEVQKTSVAISLKKELIRKK